MKGKRKTRLINQLLVGQGVLITCMAVTLVVAAYFFAPSIFDRHMREAGVATSSVRTHVFEAFSLAFTLSLIIAVFTSLAVAAVIAWYLVRRIGGPIENLADETQTLSLAMSKSQSDQERMLRDLAHELRTPISTIGALVDGIEDGVISGDAHAWKTIRDQLGRLNRLSRDARDISTSASQIVANEALICDPLVLGQSAISAWKAQFEKKGVALQYIGRQDCNPVHVDPVRVGQILGNLLDNALRHTPKFGTVRVIVEPTSRGVTFNVTDTGDGISKDQLPLIFDRLFRGDSARHAGETGSGLGLTIARSIAESHGGTLTASSEGLGKGASFVLTLSDVTRQGK